MPLSPDDETTALAVLQYALEFLERLSSTLGSLQMLRLVRHLQRRVESGEKIVPGEMSSKAWDLLLFGKDGRQIPKAHQRWVASAFDTAQDLAGIAAGFLWVHDRLIEKEQFTTTSGPRQATVVTAACSRCGAARVRHNDIEFLTAGIWAQMRVRPLIESGRISDALNETLSCGLCLAYSDAVNRDLQKKSIQVIEEHRDQCSACAAALRYVPVEISVDEVEQNVRKMIT